MRGGVTRYSKAVGSAGGVAGKHHVEAAVLVGFGELQNVVRVYPCGEFRARVDASAKDADRCPGGGFPLDSDHPKAKVKPT